MHRYLIATGVAAWAWVLTMSLYISVALLTGHPLTIWAIIAAELAVIVLWVATVKALR